MCAVRPGYAERDKSEEQQNSGENVKVARHNGSEKTPAYSVAARRELFCRGQRAEKIFHIGEALRNAIWRQALHKNPAIALALQARIEQH